MDIFQAHCQSLARNLRAARRTRRISQEQLALAAGIDRSYVSQLERGVANPSLRMLCALAAELRVSVTHLLSEGGHGQ
ncbi:helix-turn-helix domain-containing protein [Denitromonas ohlonensis]|jgi:transcriptional regulator with XRE-family HTH domain|uniref:Helix-turn-helix transcriptional regulator n=2 Tax=Denitromonas TaxID=139331 RepID=A0A558CIX4_9RHOO|nr:helix-turn-helix transcriptional regulator [Denitromonas ohlonensis]TVT48708.1 MAG: helix-turn-helix transcriptional regulator [Denitromonas halophila]TVO63579.1 helix-turn-helix transcriptional regulator [Denitromonas ohlonensis]TVO75456.1 helix-turn-helix transcriptional regulator [Denitromonas ohlonensis]TVT70548.1 MAG: helix-turn-helix transcriptional regulator [Denitromonas halophila]TVT75670.1 MAG: helix-turn-helix transcriptional regulator [Denitromonas halophila]